ncbi:MAG TPA: dTDP-4-dehydrorhamnose 3,5-epimerase [Solirubrobacteraceae bacterium]|nr:dTDP-4-dehydrorhamnose 3,5-epimerase [Solirubrobacteraceae bacterium]
MPTPLRGAYVIELDLLGDERGWFARTYDEELFRRQGLQPVGVQANSSFSAARDTLRGLHYQAAPHEEAKLVRCVRGAIWDVGVDLRRDGGSYLRWHAVELTADNRRGLYLPAGLAHGFQTLTDDTEVHYLMGHPYVPEAARGVRWDDPAFAIAWPPPHGERTISERDRAHPDFAP